MSPFVPLLLVRSCLWAPLQQPLVPGPGFPEDPRGHWSSPGVVCLLAPPIFLQQPLVHAVTLCKLQPGPFLQADPLTWLGLEAWLESNPTCIPRHSDGCRWGLRQGLGWLECAPPPMPPPRALLSPCAPPSQHDHLAWRPPLPHKVLKADTASWAGRPGARWDPQNISRVSW